MSLGQDMADKISGEIVGTAKGVRITLNPDKEFVKEIRRKLKDNNNYCPCRLEKTPDTKCMCKEFTEEIKSGACHCGLYIKSEI